MAVITVRTIIVFLSIYAAMRLMGKRQLGELEPSELVVAVLITDMAAHPLQDIGIPLLNGLLPIAILLSCELLISWLSLKSSAFRAFCFGRPSILMRDGKIILKELRRNRFSIDELCEELRGKGVTDLSKIEYAILETDGKLNLIPFPAERPVTAAQLQLPTQDGGYPHIVVSDGRMLEANLRHLGLDPAWLREELTRQGVERTEDVYLMTVDESRRCYLTRKEAEA